MPLTNMLSKQGAVNEVKGRNKVSCVFYIDVLKLVSRDETKLQQELTIIKTFSVDILMDFGLGKCATAVFNHGKLPPSQNISLNNQKVIGNVEDDETF
jgi:hypothetical protein